MTAVESRYFLRFNGHPHLWPELRETFVTSVTAPAAWLYICFNLLIAFYFRRGRQREAQLSSQDSTVQTKSELRNIRVRWPHSRGLPSASTALGGDGGVGWGVGGRSMSVRAIGEKCYCHDGEESVIWVNVHRFRETTTNSRLEGGGDPVDECNGDFASTTTRLRRFRLALPSISPRPSVENGTSPSHRIHRTCYP
jgi:hypothetical protein